jgi:hypothetical protein
MRYLLTILLFTFIACKKDKDDPKPTPEPPTITKINVLPPLMIVTRNSQGKNDTVYRPKIEVTLNVPDESAVSKLSFFVKASFPYYTPTEIVEPKTGTYTIVDMNNTYPAIGSNRIYFSVFAMKNFTYVTNSDFSIN